VGIYAECETRKAESGGVLRGALSPPAILAAIGSLAECYKLPQWGLGERSANV